MEINKETQDELPRSPLRSGLGLTDEEEENDMADTGSENAGGKSQAPSTGTKKKTQSKTPVLDNFSTDLTEAALAGKLDPVVGREREISRVIEILGRRKKNNPILIGEPGVGKSAIVEGLAQMIAQRTANPILFGKRIVALDMTGIVAGTKYRGQFEERIKALLSELEKNDDIIVFIDEIHTIIGAGSAPGAMDAANIMKPALARGTIQCIGATTLDEYRNSIEKDGALKRRFQQVLVEPTDTEQTITILHNISKRYEDHHHVSYTEEALRACAVLTDRYVPDRAQPDKAIDVLDEVGSHMHLESVSVPKEIEQAEAELAQVKEEKQGAVGRQDFEGAARLRDRQTVLEDELRQMHERWRNGSDEVRKTVTADDIAAVVANMTGIPVHRIAREEGIQLRGIDAALNAAVVGQQRAISTLTKAIVRNRVGLKANNRPIGVFMFLGPTGVGKTYLAKKLAEQVFGTPDALIRIDMSEYTEAFNVSRLIGAPPGYVGYEEGGQLTERVRRRPYSIVLLDEIEKAHGNVFNLLLQVLDEGRLTDGNGRFVDFRNTIIIMTSNAGTRQLKDFGRGVGFSAAEAGADISEQDKEYARQVVEKALTRQFSPEFLNRLDEIITFDQLGIESITKIVDLELGLLEERLAEMGYTMHLTDEAKHFLAEKGYDVQFGARPLKRAIQTYVEDEIAQLIMDGRMPASQEFTLSLSAAGDSLSITEL